MNKETAVQLMKEAQARIEQERITNPHLLKEEFLQFCLSRIEKDAKEGRGSSYIKTEGGMFDDCELEIQVGKSLKELGFQSYGSTYSGGRHFQIYWKS